MTIFRTILLSSILFLLLVSCKNNPLSVTAPASPGRRDYVWTVDTLQIPFTTLYSMSGSAPNDIWAVGPGGGLDKTIYHFDGTSWTTDGISRPVSPEAIFALSKNNIWIAGMGGEIWSYDGQIWKRVFGFDRPVGEAINFFKIWGDSPTNIFATGFSGPPENMTSIIVHFDGVNWKLNEFPKLKYNMVLIKRDPANNKYYLSGVENEPDGGEIFGLFEYDGKDSLKQIFKGTEEQTGWSFIQKINNNIYFGIGDTIYIRSNNVFNQFLLVNNPDYWTSFYGRNEKDIFLLMAYGIAHYNGSDISYLYRSPNIIHILDAVLFEKDVFFLAVNSYIGGNMMIHGKLN